MIKEPIKLIRSRRAQFTSSEPRRFDLPWLNLYSRCLHLLAALETFLRTPPTDVQVRKSLEALRRILHPVKVDQPPCASVGDALNQTGVTTFRRRRSGWESVG